MELEHNWNGRPYHSLDWELKHTFGHKVYKLSLDAGLTCPNRDGTCGTRGCIFLQRRRFRRFCGKPENRCMGSDRSCQRTGK